MIRGQHTGVHHWKVYPDPPTPEQLAAALAFEMDREGMQFVRDEKGAVTGAVKKPCWVQVQPCELVDGKPDDDAGYEPARHEGALSDEEFAKKLLEAQNPTAFVSHAAAPRFVVSGTAEVIAPGDVGELPASLLDTKASG